MILWRVVAMFCVSVLVVAGMPWASAGAVGSVSDIAVGGTVSSAGDHCPAYVDSDLYRTRANQVTLTPEDTDWELTLINAESDTEYLFEDGDYYFTRAGVYMTADKLTIRSASGNRDAVNFIGQGLFVRGEGLMVNGEDYTIADISVRETRNHGVWMSAGNGATRTHIYNVDLLDIGTQFIKGNSGAEHPDGIVACSSMGYTSIDTVVGDYFAAIDLHTSVDWIIRDNYIYNMVGDGSGCEVDIDCGSYFSHPAILVWNNSTGTIIERNTMIDNTRSITLGLGNGHSGGVVRNNYIYQSVPGDAGIELWDAEGVLVEHNTVITNNYRGAIEYGGSPNIILRNNLLNEPPLDRSGSRGANTGAILEGNISDATNADFIAPGDPHIPAGSRAIGAGVPLDTTNEIGDIDGDARNGRLDVGADHYNATNPEGTQFCDGKAVTIDMTSGATGRGTSGDDVILGTDGVDSIRGLGGDDTICAGGGNDRIHGGSGSDTIFGGGDRDRVHGGSGDDTIFGDGGSDRIWAGAGSDVVHAGSGADRVFGEGGDDILNGMGGQDFMWGGEGNDLMRGSWQSDKMWGGPGDDIMEGARGKDIIYGGAGDDMLYGGINTDYLDGGNGNDTAFGQAGKDNPLVPGASGCIAETQVSC